MDNWINYLVGGLSTIVGGVGTAFAAYNEILMAISLTCTIISTIVSCIVLPIINKVKKKKKDGKITIEEVKDIIETANDGIEETKDKIEGVKQNGNSTTKE